MTEGSEVKTFGTEWETDPFQALKECFAYLSLKGQDDGVLILVYFNEYYETKFKNDLKCQCKDEFGILTRIAFALLLQELGRDVPLFHLDNGTSGREIIKTHMTKPKPKQDLVCDSFLAKGYESEKVITCNSAKKEDLSRASIVGVEAKYDRLALWKYGFDWLKSNPDHHCQ